MWKEKLICLRHTFRYSSILRDMPEMKLRIINEIYGEINKYSFPLNCTDVYLELFVLSMN
jgi:hypothetical protein